MDYIVHGVSKSWTRLSDFRFFWMSLFVSEQGQIVFPVWSPPGKLHFPEPLTAGVLDVVWVQPDCRNLGVIGRQTWPL